MQTTQTEIMTGISESAVISNVRAFVQENFLYMMPDFELADDDRLLEKGVVDSMGISELISYIEHLSENHQETSRYEIVLWQKIIYPFAVLVMMVLALPFAYFQVREGGISGKIFTGIMLGLGFHLSNRLFGHLGLLNAWPALFSAIFPTLAFLAAAVFMMWKVEKR